SFGRHQSCSSVTLSMAARTCAGRMRVMRTRSAARVGEAASVTAAKTTPRAADACIRVRSPLFHREARSLQPPSSRLRNHRGLTHDRYPESCQDLAGKTEAHDLESVAGGAAE